MSTKANRSWLLCYAGLASTQSLNVMSIAQHDSLNILNLNQTAKISNMSKAVEVGNNF